MPWGTFGPQALTAVMRQFGLEHHAAPPDVYYPTTYHDASWLLRPDLSLDNIITPRTRAIHLFNKIIAEYKEHPAPTGSFLARLQAEGA